MPDHLTGHAPYTPVNLTSGTVRVTKIVCPSCKGTGTFDPLGIACRWCGGEERLPTGKALHYADTIYCLSGGAYIDGDMTLAELRAEEKRAEDIYALAGVRPPWWDRRP